MTTQASSALTVNESALEITMSRVFDAPRERLFAVVSDPALVPQWWGPAYLTTTVEQMDVRPGGAWRCVQRAPDGGTHVFYGVYREVSPPERLVRTFEYEPQAGHVILETLTFEDAGDGRTRLTATNRFQSLDDLRGMVASGMEGGAVESWDRLAELVEG